MSEPHYPGAAAPERSRFFTSDGVRLRVDEWGDPSAPPVVLLHGAFDHGRGFDLLAPLLASRFRVLSLTSRGHGDSEWVDSYAWQNDVADAVNLLRSLGRPRTWWATAAAGTGHGRGALGARSRAPARQHRRLRPAAEGFAPPA